jgi:hypothetical protein
MFEDTVDNAIVALLQATVTGVTILRGMQSQNPTFSLPALVVYSEITKVDLGTHADIYTFLVTIEYKSTPDEHAVGPIQTTMGQVDTALSTQPTTAVLNTIPLGQAKSFFWQAIPRTKQNVQMDRRSNTREIEAKVAFVS